MRPRSSICANCEFNSTRRNLTIAARASISTERFSAALARFSTDTCRSASRGLSSNPTGFGGRLRRGLRSYEVVAASPLCLLGGQQSFHVPVADDESRDLQPRLFHKSGAEMHVMPQVVHAQLQILQGKLRSVAAELRRQCLFGGTSESEDRNAWHRWRSFWLEQSR